jgi:hypothetical protein
MKPGLRIPRCAQSDPYGWLANSTVFGVGGNLAVREYETFVVPVAVKNWL